MWAVAEKAAAEKEAAKKAAAEKSAREKAVADSSMYAEYDGKVRYLAKQGESIEAGEWNWVFQIKRPGLLGDICGWGAKVSGKVQYVVPNGSKVKEGDLVAKIV